MFDAISDLFDRDGRKRPGRSGGLRGLLQRFMGGTHGDDRRRDRDRYRVDDDDDAFDRDDDRRYESRRRRSRDDDDDDD